MNVRSTLFSDRQGIKPLIQRLRFEPLVGSAFCGFAIFAPTLDLE